mmetsp:Transcript_5895/g.12841  ORF Transcript_5895/g.12841 Transcript_5895/m.12841 type:complete len:212 (-) Transcript_5895:82-717(-)
MPVGQLLRELLMAWPTLYCGSEAGLGYISPLPRWRPLSIPSRRQQDRWQDRTDGKLGGGKAERSRSPDCTLLHPRSSCQDGGQDWGRNTWQPPPRSISQRSPCFQQRRTHSTTMPWEGRLLWEPAFKPYNGLGVQQPKYSPLRCAVCCTAWSSLQGYCQRRGTLQHTVRIPISSLLVGWKGTSNDAVGKCNKNCPRGESGSMQSAMARKWR